MTGGTEFNEVFFTGVRVPDALRLGAVGAGWKVTLTTLGFERAGSGQGDRHIGGSFAQLLATARHLERTGDPIVRQQLSDIYIRSRVLQLNAQRAGVAARAGRPPGPEGSIGKLLWTQLLARISDVATAVVGPHLITDTGAPGTYEWGEHILGAPG